MSGAAIAAFDAPVACAPNEDDAAQTTTATAVNVRVATESAREKFNTVVIDLF
jgi:hypothetical protein